MRSTGEHYAACNIIQPDRLGGGSVIWGGISTGRHRPLTGRPYTGAVEPGSSWFLLVHEHARPHVAGTGR